MTGNLQEKDINVLVYGFFSEITPPQFLLHFQIHIDVPMLCRKFELIPSSNFRVMAILKIEPFSENFPVLYHGFFQKMAPKSPKIFITFSDTH